MKTAYFSSENLQEEALEMAHLLPGNQNKRGSTFKPEHSALLVLDMQSYFLEPSSHAFIPSATAIVPGLKLLAQSYFAHDLPVFFTQHLNSAQDAGSMSRWWKDLITIEDPLSSIIADFDFSNRYVLRKSQYDAFYQTDLEDNLNKKGISQLVVTGVMTHLCCETTARSAFVRGFEVFFIIDGTATYNKDHHLAALLNLAHGFATPVMAAEIQAALEKLSET
ncbi:MAG: isochorismatase family protein [Anaerolineales bacterium]|nr:isochorismatase family protein [Anaerolineales bacterium]